LIREVIEAHPTDYVSGEGWREDVVRAMEGIVPYSVRGLLDKLLVPAPKFEIPVIDSREERGTGKDDRRLGW
jgi:hypothetical protein